MGDVDVAGGVRIAVASSGCRMGGVDASRGGRIALVSGGRRMGGVLTSGGGRIAVASRGLVTKAPNTLRGVVGLECPGEGGLAESRSLTAG
jgi:hypothetical protein